MSGRTRPTYAALTDIGRVRTHNEDAVLAQPPLFAVADGLGGHEAGEVASSIAVETLRDHAPRRPDAKALARAVKAANREVIRAAREGYGRSGMGTTMTAALVEGGRVVLAHVGDSRAYLLSGGVINRITEDHSMVADMIRRGTLTEEESRHHPNRSVITRALGTDPNMDVDSYELSASNGDRLLLASDGLHGMLVDDEIARILGAYKDPPVAARALIDAANEAGGHDNISAVVVDITEDAGAASHVESARRTGRSGWLSVAGWVLALVVLLAGTGFGAYYIASRRAYLVAEDGVVAVYRGVPGSFAGIELSWPLERTDIAVDDLPPLEQARLADTITTDSVDEALDLVARMRKTAGFAPGGETP